MSQAQAALVMVAGFAAIVAFGIFAGFHAAVEGAIMGMLAGGLVTLVFRSPRR